MVRDGTYLIGTNCIITPLDIPMVFQSHILKFRVADSTVIDPYLLFLSFNCSLVQRQIKNMQFTADIIDTLGNRYRELILPIPKDQALKAELIASMRSALETRMKYKAAVKQMPLLIEKVLEANAVTLSTNFLMSHWRICLQRLYKILQLLNLRVFRHIKMKRSDIIEDLSSKNIMILLLNLPLMVLLKTVRCILFNN